MRNPIKVISLDEGFTMIELLMVIMLVAILGAVALPQFLDFRKEGRLAAVAKNLQAVRTGIKLQMSQARLRCDYDPSSPGIINSFSSNDVTVGGLCTTAQIPIAAERRIVDAAALPVNPFNGLNQVYICNTNCVNTCAAVNVGDCSSTSYGWCYEITTENFFAASNVASECAL